MDIEKRDRDQLSLESVRWSFPWRFQHARKASICRGQKITQERRQTRREDKMRKQRQDRLVTRQKVGRDQVERTLGRETGRGIPASCTSSNPSVENNSRSISPVRLLESVFHIH